MWKVLENFISSTLKRNGEGRVRRRKGNTCVRSMRLHEFFMRSFGISDAEKLKHLFIEGIKVFCVKNGLMGLERDFS